MVVEGDLTWDSEHTVQCTDEVVWNCAPVSPQKIFKKEKSIYVSIHSHTPY